MVDSSREALKYRIDLVSEMKFLRTSDGGEVSTEATDCEMELWRALQASRSAAIEECAALCDSGSKSWSEYHGAIASGWAAAAKAIREMLTLKGEG